MLVHHGMPGSRLLYQPHVEDASARGIRLIGYDRPGYGRSTPKPGRSVADCAADVRAIAHALDVDRLAVYGFSGGGPHALACAALLPDLVVAVSSLASSAPYGAEGLDYFNGMGELNAEDTKRYFSDPVGSRAKSKQDREELMGATAEGMLAMFSTLLSPTDAVALTPESVQHQVDSMHEGLAPGDEGWWEDGVAVLSEWGFELAAIRVPLQYWHGRQDRFVPFQHGEWLVEHIPGVEAHLTETDGHITLQARRVPEVHAWLLEHF